MPEAYFGKLKEEIGRFYGEMGQEDNICFITFGSQVTVKAQGKTGQEEIESILADVENKDRSTLLFEAVSQAAGLAEGNQNQRQVIVVVSDGEDFAEGKRMAQETLTQLKEKNIPVYGLCIKDTARENINSFGEFARTSGGDLTVFDASQAEGVLAGLRKQLLGAAVMRLQAPTNRITNKYETLSLYIPGRENPVISQVFSGRWIPDTQPPRLLSARQLEGRKLELVFSEEVIGYETASNYSLRRGETIVPISAVASFGEAENTVIITAAEAIEEGNYTISCTNICDNSQEENPVENELSLALVASDPVVEEQEPEKTPIWPFVLAVVLLAIVGLGGFALFYGKLKKSRGLVFVEGKPVLASSVDVKQHVAIAPAVKKKFELTVAVEGKNPAKMELAIDKSMIVGRSSICDLYFDDKRMSRQHFALEWDGRDMYITDLDTTNGTTVNGVRIKGKRKLDNGARISAGAEEMQIRW